MGVMLLAWSGGGVGTLWPLRRSHAWAPLLIPVAWLGAHAAVESQWLGARFLQVSLLHTFLLLQVGAGPQAPLVMDAAEHVGWFERSTALPAPVALETRGHLSPALSRC